MSHQADPELQSAPNLFRALGTHVMRLFITELRMARAELAQAASRAGAGAIYIALALWFALVAFHALAVTAVLALYALGVPVLWAAVGTTVIVLLIAAVFAAIGAHNIKQSTLKPKQTLKNLRTDLTTFEEATRV